MPRRRSISRLFRGLLVVVVAASVVAVFGFESFTGSGSFAEDMIAANGRIEVERVEVATKYAGRVDEITIREGDVVAADSIIAQLGTAELAAQLAASEAAVRSAMPVTII